MQDIDFDEIDRAVSSTIGPKPKADSPADNAVSVNVSRPEPTKPVVAPPARRSSGRFMDVVHPSSDMRSTPTKPERSEPRNDETPAPRPFEKANNDWPDPLDFHGFKNDEPQTPKEEAPVINTKSDDEPLKPLESPFLSDTKVEKRPLGAFSTETPKEALALEKEEDTPLLEAPDEELLPAETETEPEEPSKEPDTKPEPEPAHELTPEPEEPIGPTSITQQYKEQPSTTDQPSGAIFDTEAYHQPLAHPEKKRSGAMVIIWIFVLILLGAGVGAGVYFFVLPML